MMRRFLSVSIVVTLVGAASVLAAGPSENQIRQSFRMLLPQADTNRDGRLTQAECMAIYKDKSMAEKNCAYWDADRDGVITEDEYVKQAFSAGQKK